MTTLPDVLRCLNMGICPASVGPAGTYCDSRDLNFMVLVLVTAVRPPSAESCCRSNSSSLDSVVWVVEPWVFNREL